LSRIAIFHPSFKTRGGAEFLCANQARRLARHGHDVRLVTFSYDAGVWGKELPGVDVITVPERRWSDSVFNWTRGTKLLARGRRAEPELQDAELVLTQGSPSTLMLGEMNVNARSIWYCNEPPRILHLRTASPYLTARVDAASGADQDFATPRWRETLERTAEEGNKRAQLTALDIAGVRKLDGVCANSEYTKSLARATYGDIDVQVVHPFVRFADGHEKSGAPAQDGLQVLVQTRLEWLKNVDSVVRGFAAYLAADPKAVLHVVGEGEAKEALIELARELMPASACEFHGYVSQEDLDRIYKLCDVYALLSIDEPFGMVYPEAAARGLHIIGPDHGGPFEILEGGELGHCIDPFDPEALAEALRELRGLSASESDRRREAVDRSCRTRFAEGRIEEKLFNALGLERTKSAIS
jgi:glycosyltransferase involved in cell wall biosynthesis